MKLHLLSLIGAFALLGAALEISGDVPADASSVERGSEGWAWVKSRFFKPKTGFNADDQAAQENSKNNINIEISQKPIKGPKDIKKRLFNAVSSGDLQQVQKVLKSVTPDMIDSRDQNGDTAVFKALQLKHGLPVAEIVESLLHAGASPNTKNKRGMTPLLEALEQGKPIVANKLISYGADVTADRKGTTALHIAASKCYPGVVMRLIQKGAHPSAFDELLETPLHKSLQAYGIASEDTKKVCASVLETLINTGEARPGLPDNEGRLPLFKSVLENMPREIIDLLIQQEGVINIVDKNGLTPLAVAAMKNNPELVEYLISKGALVDDPSLEYSPLYMAVANGYIPMVQLLLKHGADINRPVGTEKKFTPLHWAASFGDEGLIRLLLDAGADLNACTPDGKTALTLLRESGAAQARKQGVNVVKLTEFMVRKGAKSRCFILHEEL